MFMKFSGFVRAARGVLELLLNLQLLQFKY